MAGIRHVRHLADVEALQYRKYLIGPGRRIGGGMFLSSVGASVHLHFQSGRESGPGRTVDGAPPNKSAKTA
jgi:hypothetical protein